MKVKQSPPSTPLTCIETTSTGKYDNRLIDRAEGDMIDVQGIISNVMKNLQSNRIQAPAIASAIRKQIQNLPELDTSLRSKPMVAKVADAKARSLFQTMNTEVKQTRPLLHPQKNLNTVTVTPVKAAKSPHPARTPAFFARIRRSDKDGNKITSVFATTGSYPDQAKEISYGDTKVIGNGSFGVVYHARIVDSNDMIAIKKVLQDKRFKNRELQIMRKLDHYNIVKLRYFFYTSGEKKDEVFLNLVLEYVPETVYRVARHYSKNRQSIPLIYVKLYIYQLLRALSYIHSLGVCHRDIKPQNLLLDPDSAVLKLCDFGSAKVLVPGEANVAYICSRYYRAPELIFGATDYSVNIDTWSAGCVLAELLLGQPIFPGDSGVDQLVEIIKVLGTPTREQIREMNQHYTEFRFPQIKPHPWSKVFHTRTSSDAISLTSTLLEYTPSSRLSPLQACAHSFFDELRESSIRLPSGRDLPKLFNFSPQELSSSPTLQSVLIPDHAKSTSLSTSNSNINSNITSVNNIQSSQQYTNPVTTAPAS